jgi:small GTP-binding protein
MEHVKIVAVGDGMVGKTCMLMSYTTDTFPNGYVPTIFDNYQAMIMHANKPFSVSFWDTAGQEDYDRLRPLSYPNTDVFLVCYSVVSQSSFNNISERWIPELLHFCPKASIVVVGTKADVRKDEALLAKLERRGEKLVDFEVAKTTMLAAGAKAVLECSAKTQRNLAEVVATAIDVAMADRKQANKTNKPRGVVCSIL